MINIPRIVIAGLGGGAGKTTLSLGLISALRKRGLRVRPFKKGPDYIDAGWLAFAASNPCYNLDPYMIGEKQVLFSFIRHSEGSDISVVEGNRGIYDGMDLEGSYSTARVARTLSAPVILIVDATKTTRTLGAMVLGVKRFDPKIRLSGVILNRVGGKRHETIARQSIERYAKVPVIGAIPRIGHSEFPERHMGLTPFQEHPEVYEAIEKTRILIESHIDIDRVIEIANPIAPLKKPKPIKYKITPKRVRIGVIRDSCFQFYYPENFDALRERGAELIEISAINDKALPDIDALYIGGGFPETHAVTLSKNKSFRNAIKAKVEAGLPVYAECGGLMYLGRSLRIGGKTYQMADILPISFVLKEKPEAHGYTLIEVERENPFYKKGTTIRGHEFHYSKVIEIDKGGQSYLAFKMLRGVGIVDKMDALCYKNVFATYTHIHVLGTPQWADGMINAALKNLVNKLRYI